jgi:hypothetical protein
LIMLADRGITLQAITCISSQWLEFDSHICQFRLLTRNNWFGLQFLTRGLLWSLSFRTVCRYHWTSNFLVVWKLATTRWCIE